MFVTDLIAGLDRQGADALCVWCYSLRGEAAEPVIDIFVRENITVLITTVLATGGLSAGAGITGGAGGKDGDVWDADIFHRLDVPVLQCPSSGLSMRDWEALNSGLGPYDATAGVIVPELDGRIDAPVFAFSEVVDDGDELGLHVRAYRTKKDRVDRVAGLAYKFGQLRRTRVADRRVAIVLSAFPTKRARLGNAVGLDTPASAIQFLHAMKEHGYDVSDIPSNGDALMGLLADGLTYDATQLGDREIDQAVGRFDASTYTRWFSSLPEQMRSEIEAHWGPPPGRERLHTGDLIMSGLLLGNVVIAVQPPRGYGDNPVALYHSPNLPPVHHYLAFYRWLDQTWGAHAIVHFGKHGTLEWLPGKSLALSSGCAPDAALGDVPLFYPFVVNDPGEGAQAKRRAHAVIIDHLVPPMTRADTYDDLAKLEQLFDEYAALQAIDPKKLPQLQERIWAVIKEAKINEDVGVEALPDDEEAFSELVNHIDGYLCELKDAQIRGGLHTLGVRLDGEDLVAMVLAITRLAQGSIPSLRKSVAALLAIDPDDPKHFDDIEGTSRSLVEAAQRRGWHHLDGDPAPMEWICTWLVPMLDRSQDEITNLLKGLDGGFVPAGPSGALTRGGAHTLPTGRNFYAMDPKALPSELSFEVGEKLAKALLDRHLDQEGSYPKTVGIVLWGTANMRTQGDDVAHVLALLGVTPVWEPETRRVIGVELIDDEVLGRPRIDVTVRISGFFRDAFPHMVELIDEAVDLAANAPVGPHPNFVRDQGAQDPRIFGPGPGAYGAGILDLIENRNWRDDSDLAAVYIAWSNYSYSRKHFGREDKDAMERRFGVIDVAVKTQDNREHDIFDSDDYFQDHGGMIATVRALSGKSPLAWFEDTKDPDRPVIRSMEEEAARVVRTRVVNPKWIEAMRRHGYKGALEMAATVDYLFGYDATAHLASDWMYDQVTERYVGDKEVREFFGASNPWALTAIAERLFEANERGLWHASDESLATLRDAILEAEGWEESR
jgi:cobaltochelatase CobN